MFLKKLKKLYKKYHQFCLILGTIFVLYFLTFLIPKAKKTPEFKTTLFSSNLVGEVSNMTTSLKATNEGAQVSVTRNNSKIEFTTPLSNSTLKKENGNAVYSIPEKNLQLRYSFIDKGIKEDIVLYKIPTVPLLNSNLKTTNLITKISPEGLPVFYDKSENYQFHIEPPFARDATGSITYGLRYHLIKKDKNIINDPNISQYSPKKYIQNLLGPLKNISETSYTLALEIDDAWLHDPKRVLPITIDPTIVHDTQSEFATGQMNRVQDLGTGNTAPSLSITSQQELIPDTNTIALWHMNETTGTTLADASGNGYTATLATGTSAPGLGITSILNTGTSYGGNDYASVGVTIPGIKTVEFWAYITDPASNHMIYLLNSDNSGIYTHSTTNGLLTTNLSNGIFYVNGIQSRTLIANSWNHIAVTTNVALTSLAFKLGTARNAASAAFFTGLLDEVRLSSVARSAEEIRLNAQRRPYAVYTSPLIDLTQKAGAWNSLSWTESGVATGDGETLSSGTSLVAQWNFNQSLGTTLTNSAGASSCAGTPANCDITLAGIGATNSQDEAPEMGFTSNARWGGGAFNISNNPTTALFHFDGTDTATTNFTNEIGGTLVRAGNAQTDTAQSKFGGASALFDGTGDSLTSSSSTLWQLDDGANTTNFTIDGWIRMPALQDGGIVGQALDGNDFWAIQYRLSQNAIRFRIQSAGSNIVTNDFSWVASTNTWYHLAVVKIGNSYTTYINGSSIGAFADVDVMPTWTAPLVFGTANANDFNGWLDEFRISKGIARWTSAFTPPVNPYYSSISNPASNALDPSDNFSIETWVKASENNITLMSNNNSNKDICTENGYYLGIGASGNPIFNVDVNGATAGCEATITGNNYISDGNWHFVVATFDKPNSLAKLYVDGVLVGSDTSVATSITSVTSSIFFGADGVITDSTRFYSRTLTAGEILSNYNSGNIEIQTRVGSSTDPNDGTWEAWRPTTSETSIDNFDSGSSWFWDLGIGGTDGRSALYMPKTISTDSIIKTEGSASQKLNIGGAQLDSNTTGLWHLDETSGTSAYIKDISGNNTSCTPYGTVVTNGIFGKARWFDGSVSTNYVNCTTINAALKTSDITLQAWIKTNTVDTSGSHIFTIGYGAMISLTSTGQARAQIFNGTVYQSATGPTIITDNNWHHVAGVFDNTNNLLKIYVDGVFESSIGSTETISYGNNMAIGRNVGSTAYDFTGTIDEIKVSGIALSDEEIAQSFQNGRNHRLSQTISSTDLLSLSKIPFSIASDRPGTILQAIIGESPFVNYEPDSNTVGLWHLDENDTGTTASPTAFFIDSALSNNATPGTGTSFPAYTTGKIGQGRFFDGTNDYITASNINIGNSSFTLSAWAKVNIGTSNMTIVSIGNTNATNQNVNMNIRSTGVFRFSFYSNDLDTTTTFSDTDWHLWTCTFDANSKVRKIYRDGVLQISDVSASNFTGGGVLNIGRLLSASNLSFFNGSIDEVRVDNVVRTADEIRQAYEVGLRSHPITIDFAASLVSSNLIIDSSDYSFNVNAISFGLGSSGAILYLGD